MLQRADAYLNNLPVIIDIDLDFFFDEESSILDQPFKSISNSPEIHDLLSYFSGVDFMHFVSHDEAYSYWADNNVHDAICFHFDYHHDLYISTNDLLSSSLSCLDGQINYGNYAAIAAKSGIIRKYVWVYPDHCVNNSIDNAEQISSLLGIDISSLPYSEFCSRYLPNIKMSSIVSASVCMSADFCSEEMLAKYLFQMGIDDEFKYAVYDYLYEMLYSDRYDPHKKHINLDHSCRSQIYFHASVCSGLNEIGFAGKTVHVSPSLDFSLCYLLQPDSSMGWIQGIDNISSKTEKVYLIAPEGYQGHQEQLINGSVYIIDGCSTPESNAIGCAGFDKLLPGPVSILKELRFGSGEITARLDGILLGFHQKIDFGPERLASLQSGSFQQWMGMSTEALGLLRSSPFYLFIYECKNNQFFSSQFFPLVYWERLAIRDLLGKIPAALSDTQDNGYHGLSHCLNVALFTLIYSLAEKENPFPAFMSALTHDLKSSLHDGDPSQTESAAITSVLLQDCWSEFSGPFDSIIINAVRSHSFVDVSNDIFSAILRDADRVRLSWERGYKERFFATPVGREMASSPPQFLYGVRQLLMFSEGVVLEVFNVDGRYECTAWYLNLRFKLYSSDQLSTSYLNYLIAVINAGLIVFAGSTDQFAGDFLSGITYGVDICFTVAIHQFCGEYFNNPHPAAKYILTGTLDDYLRFEDKLFHLHSDVISECHLVFNESCFGVLLDRLEYFSSDHFRLVYISPELSEVYPDLQDFIDTVLELKRTNEELSSFRILFPYSWCWSNSPFSAPRIFYKAKCSYSPVTAKFRMFYSHDIFREVMGHARNRVHKCKNCIFSINCASYDYAVHVTDEALLPVNLSNFSVWQPDVF